MYLPRVEDLTVSTLEETLPLEGSSERPSGLPTTQLKKLSAKHKEAMSLMAQGLDRATIAAVVGYEPEYISWLTKQPLCQEYLSQLTDIADAQIKAQYCKAVDVIGDTLANGTEEGKLKAAKLQFEVTGRIGKNPPPSGSGDQSDRLLHLANRLVSLLHTSRERVINGEVLSSETNP